MPWFFVFFLASGFCSILYELIWLRLAMAEFGVTTPLVSIMLSVFMAGLGAGSWIAGSLVRRRAGIGRDAGFPPLRLYALAELLIGVAALTVPLEFQWGSRILASITIHGGVSSFTYYLLSGAILALSVIPWCACMGATIPLGMFAIRNSYGDESNRSFSFLYIANLLGSIAGCSVPLLLIELSGFHATLRVGAMVNVIIAASAFAVSFSARFRTQDPPSHAAPAPVAESPSTNTPRDSHGIPVLLFLTGFATMGMEVIWIRLFTPYIGPVVYSFALVLATYLAATFAGSQIYRRWSRTHDHEGRAVWVALAFLGLLPLLTADTRLPLNDIVRVILGIAPVAGVFGFLTPMLVDRWSAGDPTRAGRGYALNVLGCVLGPLASGFVLLPCMGEHWAMLVFVLPWAAIAIPAALRMPSAGPFTRGQRMLAYQSLIAALTIFLVTNEFESQFEGRQVLRDNTATVIAIEEDMDKRLLVNGVGMTVLTPITKMMAHLPLAWYTTQERRPKNGLVICFGMGTSALAMLSWGIDATTVELVPSVPKLVGYFHPDRAAEFQSPRAHVVIDDGRRYLERSPQTYDVIVIDPPPPVSTAGSSLLYSVDFYEIAKRRLVPGGILQQWLPIGDDALLASVAKSLRLAFPNVRVYKSLEGWGWHFLASMTPLADRTAEELASTLPAAAIVDLKEWGPFDAPRDYFAKVLSQPVSLDQLIALAPDIPALEDDRPVNEYDWLRRHRGVGSR